MMLRHWIAVRWNSPGWYGEETPQTALFATFDGKKLYWDGEIQYCTWTEGMEIVHDYGLLEEDYTETSYDDEDAIRADYRRRFPIEPHDIERSVVKDVDGWLAPNGDFYRSRFADHSGLAVDLVNQFEIKRPLDVDVFDSPSVFNEQAYEILRYYGWICVAHSFILRDWDLGLPTAEQVQFIIRLNELLPSNFERYHDGICQFMCILHQEGRKGNG